VAKRPHYRELQTDTTIESPMPRHWGLWFSRYFPVLDGTKSKEDIRKDFLQRFSNLQVGDKAALRQAIARNIELAGAFGGKHALFTSSWRFVTGMGLPHPLENGFLWHQTLAVPYLPGSAVKGLIRAQYEREHPDEKEKLFAIFGSDETAQNTDAAKAGGVVFLDAIPPTPPTISVDVMTPHYGKWYLDGGKPRHDGANTPADWHNPVPVPFITARDISLLVTLLPRPGAGIEPGVIAELLEMATRALRIWGAGAKTNAGYGRFRRDDAELAKLVAQVKSQLEERQKEAEAKKLAEAAARAEQERLAAMSPAVQAFLSEVKAKRDADPDKNKKLSVFACNLLEAKQAEYDETVRREIALQVIELLKADGSYEDPKKPDNAKNKALMRSKMAARLAGLI
jgi:CRISPR-associated protein Cmr6